MGSSLALISCRLKALLLNYLLIQKDFLVMYSIKLKMLEKK